MQKIVFFILLVFGFCTPVFAQCDTSVCKQPPYPVTEGAGSFFSKITGMNFIVTKTAESAIERSIKNNLGAEFDVEIIPYGGKELFDGKFKKITADGENVVIDGMHFSRILAESLCEYNQFIFKDFYREIYTAEPFLLGYQAVLTSDDLQKTLLSEEYEKLLNSLTLQIGGISMLRVFAPQFSINGDRLHLSVNIASPMFLSGSSKKVSADIRLEVQDGQIVFSDIEFGDGLKYISTDALLPVINKLNPFVYKANIMDNKNCIVKVSDIKVADGMIVIKGSVLVPKNYYETEK